MTPARSWSRFACLVIMRSSGPSIRWACECRKPCTYRLPISMPSALLVHVRRGTGHKDRLVPLSPDAGLDAPIWASHRNPVWIFSFRRTRSTCSSRLRQAHVGWHTAARHQREQWINSVGRIVASPHTRCVTAMPLTYLSLGVNLRLIQKYLGHSSLQTTTTYLHMTSFGEESATEKDPRLDGLTIHSSCTQSLKSFSFMGKPTGRSIVTACQPIQLRPCGVSELSYRLAGVAIYTCQQCGKALIVYRALMREPSLSNVPVGEKASSGLRNNSHASCLVRTSFCASRCPSQRE